MLDVNDKRKIEVFSAGCPPVCENMIELVSRLSLLMFDSWIVLPIEGLTAMLDDQGG